MTFETEINPIRVCPNCGSEFQPHVAECLDCGTATVAAWEGMTQGIVTGRPGGAAAGGGSAAFGAGRPPGAGEDLSGFDVRLRSGDVDWLRPLLARLGREGIETRLVPHPDKHHGSVLIVLVRPADEERARQIDLKVYLKQVPDLPGSLNRGTTDACPACGSPVSASTSECPECGLAIWEEGGEAEEGDEAGAGEDDGSIVPTRPSLRPPSGD